MNNLSSNNLFLILVIIFVFFVIVETYLNVRHILATILLIIFLYFFYRTLQTREKEREKNLEKFSSLFSFEKYPFIIRTTPIYDIYSQLSFLNKYNSISFNDSAFYMNKFLETVSKFEKIVFLNKGGVSNTKDIEDCIDYSNESLNLLSSIILSIPNHSGIYKGQELIRDPSTEFLNYQTEKLFNIVSHIREEIIQKINIENKLNISINSSFLDDEGAPSKNILNTLDYMDNFNLY